MTSSTLRVDGVALNNPYAAQATEPHHWVPLNDQQTRLAPLGLAGGPATRTSLPVRHAQCTPHLRLRRVPTRHTQRGLAQPRGRLGGAGQGALGRLWRLATPSLLRRRLRPRQVRYRRYAEASLGALFVLRPACTASASMPRPLDPTSTRRVVLPDLAGAEFELFEHLLSSGAAGALVDEASVEWHLGKRVSHGDGAQKKKLHARQQRIVDGLAAAGVRLTKWTL